MSIEVVESAAAAEVKAENFTVIRFVKQSNKGGSDKAPKFRALLSLQGALAGMVLEAPIFQDGKSGAYSVGMPGGRFKAIAAEPMTVESNGQRYILATPDEQGQRRLDNWEDGIRTAFYAYLQSGIAEQRVTFDIGGRRVNV